MPAEGEGSVNGPRERPTDEVGPMGFGKFGELGESGIPSGVDIGP